jgi:hypothetical protein
VNKLPRLVRLLRLPKKRLRLLSNFIIAKVFKVEVRLRAGFHLFLSTQALYFLAVAQTGFILKYPKPVGFLPWAGWYLR